MYTVWERYECIKHRVVFLRGMTRRPFTLLHPSSLADTTISSFVTLQRARRSPCSVALPGERPQASGLEKYHTPPGKWWTLIKEGGKDVLQASHSISVLGGVEQQGRVWPELWSIFFSRFGE
jgi:hypothetical protein